MNTSTRLQGDHIKEILKGYMGELRAKGYSTSWRREVLESGLTGFRRMWPKEIEEGVRLNRPEAKTRLKRRAAYLVGQSTWFKGFNNRGPPKKTSGNRPKKDKRHTEEKLILEGILFIPHTLEGILRRNMQELEDQALSSYQFVNKTPSTKEMCGRINASHASPSQATVKG